MPDQDEPILIDPCINLVYDLIVEFRQIRYFLAVAEELHFGRAATRLHVSQPPLSQQIQSLEEEMGVRLFERTSRHVALTEAGRLFRDEITNAMDQIHKAVDIARRAHRGELGELTIGTFPSAPVSAPVARMIALFRELYPGAKLTLKDRQTHTILEEMREGKLEIAFLRYDTVPPVPDQFAVDLVLRERLFAVFRKDHPLASRKAAVGLGDLRNEKFIHFPAERNNPLFLQFMALCREAGFEPQITQEVNSNNMILALVAAGIGISLLPESVCRFSLPEIVTKPLTGMQSPTGIWLAYAKKARSPLVASFVACRTG